MDWWLLEPIREGASPGLAGLWCWKQMSVLHRTTRSYKRVKQSGDTTFPVSWPVTAHATMVWASYSGVVGDEGVAALAHTVSSASYTSPSVTPAGAGRWAAVFSYAYSASSGNQPESWTPPSGFSERTDFSPGGASPYMTVEIADSNGAVPQTSNSYTATLNHPEPDGASILLYFVPSSGMLVTEVAAVNLAATAGLTATGTTVSGATPKFDTLVDTFTGSSLNSSVWNFSGTNVAVVSNQLQISSSLTAATYQVFTQNFYDLTNSQLALQLADGGVQTINSWQDFPILLQDSGGTNQLYWYTLQGFIAAYKVVAGTSTQVFSAGYSPTTHQWLRIREAAGTTYWEYSADGLTWVTAHSEADPITETSLRLIIQAGQYNVEASTTAALYDNVNNLPVAVNMAATAGLTTANELVTEIASVTLAAATSLTVTPVQKISTLVDDFSSGSLDPALWNHSSTNVAVVSQQLQISSTLTAASYQVFSQSYYDLTNSQVAIQLVNAGNETINSWDDYPILLQDTTGTNQLYWYVLQGTIAAYKVVAGTQTQVFATAYSGTTHQWLRIREAGGTTYWEYAPDGIVWTVAHSEADPISEYYLRLIIQAGQYNVETSTTTAIYDNVNVLPVGANPAAQANVTVNGAAAGAATGSAAPAAVASVTAGGVVTQLGIAAPTAAASVTANGVVTVLGAAAPAAVASVTTNGVVTRFGTAAPAATASITTSGTVTSVGIAAPAAVASVTTSGVVTAVGIAAPTAVASVNAVGSAGTVTVSGTAAVTAATSVTTNGVVSVLGAAAPAVTASITASGVVTVLGIAAPAAIASVTTTGIVTRLGVAAPTATTSVTVIGTVTQLGIAVPAATTNITANGVVTRFGVATPAAAASVTVAGTVVSVGIAAPAAVASITAAGTVTQFGVAAPAAVVSITANGGLAGIGLATAAAVVSVTATGVVAVIGIAAPTAVASVAVNGVVTKLGVVAPAAVASITASGIVTALGIAAPTAIVSITVTGGLAGLGLAAPTAVVSVTTSGVVSKLGVASPAAVASIVVNGVVTVLAIAAPAAVVSVAATATITQAAAVAMFAATTLTGQPLPATIAGQVNMAGASSMSLVGQVFGNVAVIMSATASLTGQPLPQFVPGQVSMASQAALTTSAKTVETATVLLAGVASLMVFVTPHLAGSAVFTAHAGMTVFATSAPGARVVMHATTDMQVVATTHHITPVAPTLADQIAAVAGQDPILLGATGYGDDVFTSRLVGDTN